MKNGDKIRNVSLVYYKGSEKRMQRTYFKFKAKLSRILRTINWKKWTRVEIVVRYKIGENAMTLKNKSDAVWALQCFIKEYAD